MSPPHQSCVYRSLDPLEFGRFGPPVFVDPDGTTGSLELVAETIQEGAEPNGQATLDLQVTVFTSLPGDAVVDLAGLSIERAN